MPMQQTQVFLALVQQMADEAVRSGVRAVPGFELKEEKKAI